VAITAATIVVAVSHELAAASGTPRGHRIARALWGPYFTLLVLFAVVVVTRVSVIFF